MGRAAAHLIPEALVDRSTAPARRSGAPSSLALRGIVALALLASAYLHVALASGPWTSGGQLTMATLFVAQAVVAALAALWVLALPSRPAWLAAAVVGLGSLAAVVVASYVQVPAIGPLPSMYDPGWYSDKVWAAVTAGAAGIGALAGLAPSRTR